MAFTTKKKAARIAMFIGTVGVSAALVGAGVAATGAYFSDTKSGTIAGTMGSIKINTTNTTLSFANMLPGEPTSQQVDFTNSGLNAQDVWVVFNDADMGDHIASTDVGDINSRGTYGEVLIESSGDDLFWSNNLNDDPASCAPGTGAPGPICNPVPHMLKLRSNVTPGQSSDMKFTFTPAAKLKGGAALPAFVPIRYSIVATQVNIAPNNALSAPLPY